MDYNHWRAQVAQWQGPIKAWAETKEAHAYFDKAFQEHGDKPSKAPWLSKAGLEILLQSPIARFIAQCNKTGKRGSIVIDDMMITVLVTDADVLEIVPLEHCKILQSRKRMGAIPWLDQERYGVLIYFDAVDPKGNWSAWYCEPVKKNPSNQLECNVIFMLYTFYFMNAVEHAKGYGPEGSLGS